MKSKLIKGLILGIGITFLSSGMVFAAENTAPQKDIAHDAVEGSPAEVPADQIDPDSPVMYITDTAAGSDSVSGSASGSISGSSGVDEALLRKQMEIDIYLFKEHWAEIEGKGIFVTHTAPIDNYIEIGITPFTNENAEYLYGILGKDSIQVIEGQKTEIYETTAVNNGEEKLIRSPEEQANLVNVPDNGEARIYLAADSAVRDLTSAQTGISNILFYSIGALVVLGAIAILFRRRIFLTKQENN